MGQNARVLDNRTVELPILARSGGMGMDFAIGSLGTGMLCRIDLLGRVTIPDGMEVVVRRSGASVEVITRRRT